MSKYPIKEQDFHNKPQINKFSVLAVDNKDKMSQLNEVLLKKLASTPIIPQQSSFTPPYNPFLIPPSLQQSQLHRLCTQFGTASLKCSSICKCCQQGIKQPFSVCCQLKAISGVNQSLGYFFMYVKVLGAMLFLIICAVGIYSLYQTATICKQDQQCIYVYGLPITKFHLFYNYTLLYINVAIIILLYLFVAYLYYRNAKLHRKIIMNQAKPSDYWVMISGVDHQKITGQIIKQFLKDYQITDVLYTHKIKKYIHQLSIKSHLMAKRDLYFKHGHNQKVKKMQQKIRHLDNSLLHIKNKFSIGQQLSLRTDKIFIQFSSPLQKHKFLSQFSSPLYLTILNTFLNKSTLQINSTNLFIQPIGQPHQIVWENLEVRSKTRYLRVALGNCVAIILLGISYLLIVAFTKAENETEGAGDIVLSVVFAIVIEGVNFLLDIIIQKLTDWEQRYTLTGKINSIIIKSFISFFLNTTFIPFSLFLFSWGNTDENDLIRNIFTLFLVSNFISPYINNYIQPQFLLNWIKRRKLKKSVKNSMVTQSISNKIFQKSDFQLNNRYSLLLQRISNSLFYGGIFPIGVILTFFSLIPTYWSSKYWLVKYCSIPKYSYRLGKLINDLTCWFPVVYSAGYTVNLYMVDGQVQIQRFYTVVLAIITVFITLIYLLYAHRIAEIIVTRQEMHKSVDINNIHRINDKYTEPDYRQLNPTTFIHQSLNSQIKQTQFQNMWDNLLSYTIQKQVRGLRRSYNPNRQQVIVQISQTTSNRTQKIEH